MVNSIPIIYQNDISYTKYSQTIIKYLTFMSSDSQKDRKKRMGLKKYLKYFDGGSEKDNCLLWFLMYVEEIFTMITL